MELTRRAAIQSVAAATVAGGVSLAGATSAQAAFATLKPGMKSAAVRDLQIRLARLGYWLGAADSAYGHLTTQAVMAIQGAAGVARDGICGPVTWSKVVAGVRPTARSRSGKVIEVDKYRQIIKFVVNGRLYITIHTSTGSNQRYYSGGAWHTAYTPTGHFRVFRQVNAWDKSPLGELYRPKYYYGGYAIHGSLSIPGYPASHGCCRVSTGAMNLFWGTSYPIQIGTAVWVY
ncbi:MAG: L,D-transpeptidase family protein [Micrococcales bacterium]|nr:L,D-transpeptidase family protein [Micrococcales bacterium]